MKLYSKEQSSAARASSGERDFFSLAELNLDDSNSNYLTLDETTSGGGSRLAPYPSSEGRLIGNATSSRGKGTSSQALQPVSSRMTSANRHHDLQQIKSLRLDTNERLFGRDSQVAELADRLETARINSKRELVWVSGESGTGKTALVNWLRRSHMPRQQHSSFEASLFYFSGKFDLQHQSTPFGGFVEAFGSPLAALIGSNQDLRDAILRDLEEDLGTLVRLAPGLGTLLPSSTHDQPNENEKPVEEDNEEKREGETSTQSEETGFIQSLNRLKYVFRRFVRILARLGTLVLTFDDLQWADHGSLDLIETLYSDFKNTSGISILCTCRRNEIQVDGLLDQHRQAIVEYAVTEDVADFHEIQLGNLEVKDISDLVAELLDTDPQKTLDLANLLKKRTMGNPYFIIESMRSLEAGKHIHYNVGLCKWTWQINDIEQKMPLANNVISHMMAKVNQSRACDALQILACLGASFSKDLITKVSMREREGGESQMLACMHANPDWLQECIDDGFVEQIEISNCDFYRFVHDSVQEAAFLLIEGNKKRFKFKLGLVLWKHLKQDELDRILYSLVDLLNDVELNATLVGLLPTATLLSSLNLSAGIKAKKEAAHHTAYDYITRGIKALPELHWEDHFDLSMELYKSAAETSHSCGKSADTMKYCDAILKQPNCPLLSRMSIESMILDIMMANGEARGAVSLALSVLSIVGCTFPNKQMALLHVGKEFLKTKRMLRGKSREDLLSLPRATDQDTILMMEILSKLARSSYMSQDFGLLFLAQIRLTRYVLKYGISESSAVAFCGYGFFQTVVLQNLREGSFYAQLSLDWLRKLKSRAMASQTCLVSHLFVLHWTTPTPLMLKAFLKAYQVGFSMGNTFNAGALLNQYLALALNVGRPLPALVEDIRAACKQMLEYNLSVMQISLVVYLQYGLNLMGKSEVPYLLKGEAIDQDAVFPESNSENGFLQKVYIIVYQLRLTYFFGQYDLGKKLIKKSEEADVVKALTSQLPLIPTAVFSGLIYYALARRDGRRKYIRRGNRFLSKLEKWRKMGSPNCDHYLSLLRAEVADLSGKPDEARKLYETSMAISSRQGLINDGALVNECLAIFYLRHGDQENSNFYMRRGHRLYTEWGALAMSRRLEQLYPEAFLPGEGIGTK